MVSVLFVCHANICRSPLAEGIFRHLIQQRSLDRVIRVDSAGTNAGLFSSPPDARARKVASERGIDLGKGRSRRIRDRDFSTFDHILAMDSANIDSLMERCPEEHQGKVSLVLAYGEDSEVLDVPDPYYGNEAGFEHVYELLHPALERLSENIIEKLSL